MLTRRNLCSTSFGIISVHASFEHHLMIFFSSIIFPRLLKEHDARKVVIHVKNAKIITFVEDKLTIAAKRTSKVQ